MHAQSINFYLLFELFTVHQIKQLKRQHTVLRKRLFVDGRPSYMSSKK